MKQIQQYCDEIIEREGIYHNSYFENLRNGNMSLAEFRKTQEQFYFAVLFFARPMTALIARFPHPKTRLTILENVVEEHGGFKENAFHESTFREFLDKVGSDVEELDSCVLWPEIRAFNSVLSTACIFDEAQVGVACMGAIEYAFAEISAIIGRSVVKHNWLSENELCHYKLHSKIDRRHAAEFFEIIDEDWNDSAKRYLVQQGIEMGIYCFSRLYRDLYERASAL